MSSAYQAVRDAIQDVDNAWTSIQHNLPETRLKAVARRKVEEALRALEDLERSTDPVTEVQRG